MNKLSSGLIIAGLIFFASCGKPALQSKPSFVTASAIKLIKKEVRINYQGIINGQVGETQSGLPFDHYIHVSVTLINDNYGYLKIHSSGYSSLRTLEFTRDDLISPIELHYSSEYLPGTYKITVSPVMLQGQLQHHILNVAIEGHVHTLNQHTLDDVGYNLSVSGLIPATQN